MKNVKFNANELLDSLNRELNQIEINEIYKALIAYDLGYIEIDKKTNDILDDIIENDFYGQDYIESLLNTDLMQLAQEKLKEK